MKTFCSYSKAVSSVVQLFLVEVNSQPLNSFKVVLNHCYYTDFPLKITKGRRLRPVVLIHSMKEVCNKRRLTASDCQEGNRRDCSMSGNQTSGKEGEVQCVLTVVCRYVCLILYISD